MVARIASDPILVSTQSLTDLRSRQVTGERTLVQDSTPAAPKNADTGERFPDPEQQQAQPERHEPAPPLLPPGAMFAAAVIAGRLSPRPQTLEEVYVRIGSSWIPPNQNCNCATCRFKTSRPFHLRILSRHRLRWQGDGWGFALFPRAFPDPRCGTSPLTGEDGWGCWEPRS